MAKLNYTDIDGGRSFCQNKSTWSGTRVADWLQDTLTLYLSQSSKPLVVQTFSAIVPIGT